MKVETVILPAFLAPALINGDYSGLEPGDEKLVEACIEFCKPGRIVSCEGEPYFASIMPWGTRANPVRFTGDVLEYTVLYDRGGA